MADEKKELKDEELEKAQGGLRLAKQRRRLDPDSDVLVKKADDGDDDDKPGAIAPAPKLD